MKNKSYAVIGLGQFGMTVALTLAEANCDVLAIDDKDDNVQDIAEKVSYAVNLLADFGRSAVPVDEDNAFLASPHAAKSTVCNES